MDAAWRNAPLEYHLQEGPVHDACACGSVDCQEAGHQQQAAALAELHPPLAHLSASTLEAALLELPDHKHTAAEALRELLAGHARFMAVSRLAGWGTKGSCLFCWLCWLRETTAAAC